MVPGPPSETSGSLVPVWLDRLASVGWRLLVTAALALVLWVTAAVLASVVASILVSMLAAAVLAPLVRGLRARGRSRAIAAAIGLAVGVVALGIVVAALVIAIAPSVRDIVLAIEAGLAAVSNGLTEAGAPGWTVDALNALMDSVHELIAINPASVGETAVTVGTVAVLAFFLTFFLLQDGDRAWAWGMTLMAPWKAETLTDSAQRGLRQVSRYVGRTAVLAVADAIVAGVLLTVLGVPYAMALTAITFLAGFVPYVGGITVTVGLALVTLAAAGSYAALLVVVALTVTAALAPRALVRTSLGDSADANPIIVMLAIPVAAALFGVLGLVVALPVTVFLLTASRSIVAVLGLGPASGNAAWGVPVWLDRLAQWSWRALVLVGVTWVAIQVITLLPAVVVPAVLAVVIAATILPVVQWRVRAGSSRAVAAATVTVGSAVLVALAFAVSIAWTVRPLQDILAVALQGANELKVGWLDDAVTEIGSSLTINVGKLLGGLLVLALSVTLGMLLTFFFLRDGPRVWDRLTTGLDGPRRDRLDRAGERALHVLAGYMRGTALVSLFGAVTSWLIMALLGLPLAVPIGVLTFFGGFIPYVGSFVATALAFLVAVALGTTTDVVIMAIYTVVFNLIQGSAVAPIVYGKSLSLHPAVVLLAVPIGGAVAGILGMFLVVPIAAIISATWRLVIEIIESDAADERGGTSTAGAPGASVPAALSTT